jgi:hypothetical protein
MVNVTSGSINVDGTLVVTNLGPTPALGDSFILFSQPVNGSFANLILPSLTNGYLWTNRLTIDGSIAVVAVSNGPGTFTNRTGITGFSLNGANVVITGTNGQAGDAYYLLESTNLILPQSQWTVVATNVLGSSGSYTFIGTNVVTTGVQQQFYMLSNTNN